jgi:arylsulfatase A-like enzyme
MFINAKQVQAVFARWLIAGVALAISPLLAASDKPNVVFMLSDNLGYGDLGVYGGGIIRGAATPRIDALAAQGMRFTNFNVEAECTPSRSALMTGRYAVRSGTTRAVPLPGIPQGMAPWEYTMAEMFKDAGYDTAIFGKWHIGASEGRFPTDQGFNYWWGFPNSTDVARFPTVLGFEEGLMPKFNFYEGTADDGLEKAGEYSLASRPFVDDEIVSRAVAYLGEAKQNGKPFFLYLPFSLVHHPSLPHPDFDGKTGQGRFADALAEHDYRVGEILDALDELGLAENTVVVYASDNGPDRAEYPHIGDTGPYRGYLGTVHEGSVRTPMMLRWPGKIEPGRVTNDIVAIHDFMPTFAAIVGEELPDDRSYDGVNQLPFLTGEATESARDALLFFHDSTLMAMKWKQFKLYLKRESPDREDGRYADLWAPEAFNVVIDPKETNNIAGDGYLWLLSPLLSEVLPFMYSLEEFGLIEPGADERTEGTVTIPFFKQSLVDASLSELRKQAIKKKLFELSGGLMGEDPSAKPD